jgi:hypothetical protein
VFFQEHFKIRKGDYRMYVVAIDESGEPLAIESADFLIFESHIRTLRLILDEYKHGFGINLPPPPERAPLVWPRLQASKLEPAELKKAFDRYGHD